MSKRIILRFSLNKDTNSAVRNHIASILSPTFSKTSTGTWESKASPAPASALTAAASVLTVLNSPTSIQGANASVTVDHLWLYVD